MRLEHTAPARVRRHRASKDTTRFSHPPEAQRSQPRHPARSSRTSRGKADSSPIAPSTRSAFASSGSSAKRDIGLDRPDRWHREELDRRTYRESLDCRSRRLRHHPRFERRSEGCGRSSSRFNACHLSVAQTKHREHWFVRPHQGVPQTVNSDASLVPWAIETSARTRRFRASPSGGGPIRRATVAIVRGSTFASASDFYGAQAHRAESDRQQSVPRS